MPSSALLQPPTNSATYADMADSSSSNPAQEIEINVRPPGGGDKKIPIKVDTSKTVAELKQDIATHTDIPAENQRLIYSGRVLKDEEQVSTYKIR
jgi:ubiquilin